MFGLFDSIKRNAQLAMWNVEDKVRLQTTHRIKGVKDAETKVEKLKDAANNVKEGIYNTVESTIEIIKK